MSEFLFLMMLEDYDFFFKARLLETRARRDGAARPLAKFASWELRGLQLPP